MSSLGSRISTLDGLRGLAILMVMGIHITGACCSTAPPGSWIYTLFILGQVGGMGVDLFFVLSGFLITSILLEAKGSSHYFRDFYMRRMLRIFPLYYGTLFVLFAVLPSVVTFSQLDMQVAHSQFWLWAFSYNILVAVKGYWFQGGSWLTVSHFWTLSIEWQFYLVWAVVAFMFSRERLGTICIGMIVTALGIRILMLINQAPLLAIDVLTFTRMDTLAVGAFMAIVLQEKDLHLLAARCRFVLAACSPVFLLVGYLTSRSPDQWTQYDIYNSIYYSVGLCAISLFFGALLIMTIATSHGGWLSRIFNSRGLRFFGKYSYALYVFHVFVVVQFARMLPLQTLIGMVHLELLGLLLSMFIPILISLSIVVLSWNLYEKQFLKLKRFFPYRKDES